jgi:protein NrfD
MHELTTTRHNPLIDPACHVWGWEIPVYLFLGGLVAGMMIISGYLVFSGRYRESSRCACFTVPLLGLVLLSLGMLTLFLDLAHKLYTWRLYTTFQVTSPMSWGAWILIFVYPAQLVTILVRSPATWSTIWKGRLQGIAAWSERLSSHPQAVKTVGLFNMVLGALLGLYTGVLLSSLGARPLWNSAVLWLLFLVSGLSSAAALVHMIASERSERELLAKADNGFLAVELVVIALYFIGLATTSAVHLEAAGLLWNGAFAPVFWVFVIGLGIVIPLGIQLLAVNHKIAHTPIAPILVITGGLILRFVIVYAGQASEWHAVAGSFFGF